MRIIKWCILIGIVVVLITFGFMKVLEEGKVSDIIQAITAIILFTTAVILWKYTYETMRLREEAQRKVEVSQKQVGATKEQTKVSQDQVDITQRQIEVQQRPFVIVQDIIGEKIRLRSIGTSSAINIEVRGAKQDIATDENPNPNIVPFSSRNTISFILRIDTLLP
jgi:hypothetical protein